MRLIQLVKLPPGDGPQISGTCPPRNLGITTSEYIFRAVIRERLNHR
jgi:hypothetical protein